MPPWFWDLRQDDLRVVVVAEGLRRGETCLHVTIQDTAEQLIRMVSGFGWDLNGPKNHSRRNRPTAGARDVTRTADSPGRRSRSRDSR
jgi:KaiC/GvpD/RAD55 family RecA-like ATPase